jgi:hypothetical protein
MHVSTHLILVTLDIAFRGAEKERFQQMDDSNIQRMLHHSLGVLCTAGKYIITASSNHRNTKCFVRTIQRVRDHEQVPHVVENAMCWCEKALDAHKGWHLSTGSATLGVIRSHVSLDNTQIIRSRINLVHAPGHPVWSKLCTRPDDKVSLTRD